MRKLLPVFCLLLLTKLGQAQLSEPYNSLKAFIQKQPSLVTDSTPFLSFYHKGEINYLYPLHKAIQQQNKHTANAKFFYDDLSHATAMVGDYSSALTLEKLSFDPLPDSLKQYVYKEALPAKEVQYEDANTYILSRTNTSNVVMINEARNKPLHRVFTASLLAGLYQQGFRYLAMETLNNTATASLNRMNIFTGHYTCEPVMGEMVRKALELGFTLIPYEDTLSASHTPNQREYAQATNLYAILKKDSTAKILVHAGSGHLEEGASSDGHIPMAAYFRTISGIDPLTIDQATMTEGSTSAYGSTLYDEWLRIHPVTSAVVPLLNQQPYDPVELGLFDIQVIHPPTKYRDGRPTWTAMNGWKKETPVRPAFQGLFLIQAYYEGEYQEKTTGRTVPADQTYNTDANGYYFLYLRKGKYTLVFRDKLYKILGTKEITVT